MDDLRTLRTRKIIKNSFIDLLNMKSFDSLTVNEISNKAMINRATFYRHFDDKYDLLMEILQESMEEMMRNVGSIEENMYIFSNHPDFSGTTDSLLYKNVEFLSSFFEYFEKNRKVFKPLLGENGSIWFSSEMNKYLSKFWISRIKSEEKYYKQTSQNGIISVETASIWLAHSVVSILGWWLNKGTEIPAETMAKSILSIIVQGYYKTLGLDQDKSKI
jgi:AcrR family transcriptional regulator